MNDLFPPWAGILVLGLSVSLLAGCSESGALQAPRENAAGQPVPGSAAHDEADRLALTPEEI